MFNGFYWRVIGDLHGTEMRFDFYLSFYNILFLRRSRIGSSLCHEMKRMARKPGSCDDFVENVVKRIQNN